MTAEYRQPSELAQHNHEVKKLWEAYHQGDPWRVPVIFNYGIRCRLLSPELNTRGYTFQQYCDGG
ncbi:MAG: hypothetical protein GX354_12300 [Firmicutes bacterium]|jgi:hypothetical protein|nr:hypothetical protein [Bacillota bacterium]